MRATALDNGALELRSEWLCVAAVGEGGGMPPPHTEYSCGCDSPSKSASSNELAMAASPAAIVATFTYVLRLHRHHATVHHNLRWHGISLCTIYPRGRQCFLIKVFLKTYRYARYTVHSDDAGVQSAEAARHQAH